MWCELLKERLSHLCQNKDKKGNSICPPTLIETVSSIIWSADRIGLDVKGIYLFIIILSFIQMIFITQR